MTANAIRSVRGLLPVSCCFLAHACAKRPAQFPFFSRSHDAVIRVYDDPGNVIETHEHGNPTEARSFGAMFLFPTFFPLRVSSAPFPLFPRVILPPVLSRAYSAPATLFDLIHKIKITDLADQTVMNPV
ncbi:MAG: hypothetical protein DME98_01470 [Verrucomicrobia bacterium]|nr:MAG: hypothetical protein DME98_01470 [Verrucomicrobiota bacterium]